MEENQNNKKGFYIALYSTVAIIAMVAIGVSSIGDKPEQNAEVEVEQGIPANQSPVKSYKESTTLSSTTETTTKQVAEAATEATTAEKRSTAENTGNNADAKADNSVQDPAYTLFDDTQEMIWPVNGQIVMDYSIETGIFDKTLEQYRTHDSICISANVGESVFAAADGVVSAITNSNEKGNMVAIDHGNGWCTTYSQIDNINLAEGQVIKQGDIIGCIAQPTKYGVGLGSHLDFMVALDKQPTDPKLILKMEE